MTSSSNYSTTLFCKVSPNGAPRYITKIQTMPENSLQASVIPEHCEVPLHAIPSKSAPIAITKHIHLHPPPQHSVIPKTSALVSTKRINFNTVSPHPIPLLSTPALRSARPVHLSSVPRQVIASGTSIQMSTRSTQPVGSEPFTMESTHAFGVRPVNYSASRTSVQMSSRPIHSRPQQFNESGSFITLQSTQALHMNPVQPAAHGTSVPETNTHAHFRAVPQQLTAPGTALQTSTTSVHFISVPWRPEAYRRPAPSLMKPVVPLSPTFLPQSETPVQQQSTTFRSHAMGFVQPAPLDSASRHLTVSTTNYSNEVDTNITRKIQGSAFKNKAGSSRPTNNVQKVPNDTEKPLSDSTPQMPFGKPPKYRQPPAVYKSVLNHNNEPNKILTNHLAKFCPSTSSRLAMTETPKTAKSDCHNQQNRMSRHSNESREISLKNGETGSLEKLAKPQQGNAAPLRCKADWNMAAYLVGLTAKGGLPFINRKTNDFKELLPFPVTGLLTAAHMFAKQHDTTLLTTETKDFKIVWREFYDSIALIIITTNDETSDHHLYEFLETIFHAMVMFIGLDNIINMRNVEILKRDLRTAYGLIDTLLSQLVQPSTDLLLVGDLTYAVDYLMCPESTALQPYLDSFAEGAYSTYGCLIVHGRIVVATKKWWTLNVKEMVLLCLFLASSPQMTCRDVPIFLPFGSPKVAHRFLVFQLVQGIEVCVLCAEIPTLTQLEKEVGRFWKGAYELLKSSLQYRYRSFPSTIPLDRNILGVIAINREDRKCLCSVYLHGTPEDGDKDDGGLTAQQRLGILRSFYKRVAGTLFSENSNEDSSPKGKPPESREDLLHECCESYANAVTYKLYAAQTSTHQILILFSSAAPTFALRSMTHRTLQALTRGRILRL